MFKKNVYMAEAGGADAGGGVVAEPLAAPAAVVEPAAIPATASGEASPASTAPAVAAPESALVDAPSWDDGWRDKIAGQDEKTKKYLERFTSVKALADASIATNKKISSGEIKFPLKAGATPEEAQAWRKDQGIPEKYSDYDVGIVKDNIKPLAESFLKHAHANNFTPEKARAVVDFIAQETERLADDRRAKDDEGYEKANEVLRSEWGGDFKSNFNAISNMMDKHGPEGFAAELFAGRLANGTIIGDSPAAMRMLAGLARELNPFATIVPGSGQNQINAANTRIAEIEAMMTDDNSAYNKRGTMQAVRTEYRNLVDARLKQGAR